MTTQQIKWAQGHDWYIDKSDGNNAVLVTDEWVENGEIRSELTWFDDFHELLVWAGY